MKVKKMVALALTTAMCAGLATQPVMADDGYSLTVSGIGGSLNWLPVYIAQQEGWFEEENLEIEEVLFTNGPVQMESLSSDGWDIGCTGVGGVIAGVLGYDAKILGASNTDDGTQYVFARSDAPHLIYTPERPFKEEEFLTDVKKLYDKLGGVVVVVSEGLKKEDGTPVVDPIYKTDRAVYYGDVSAHLANLVIKRLGIKARNEKPGLCGRASIAWQSPVDCQEAQLAGEKALEAAIKGHTGVMIGFKREKTEDGSYKIGIIEIPIEKVMLLEKTLPDEYINVRGNDITEEYIKWLQPLVGPKFEEFLDFKEYYKEKE